MEKPRKLIVRRGIMISSIFSLVIMVLFVGIAYGVDYLIHPVFSPTGLLITGIGMAILPAIIWLFFFYEQDRREPEPKGLIAQVFILGGLLAMAIGIPLVEDVYRVSSWIYRDSITTILGAVLVIGFVQEFLKFAAVRFSVYGTAEFDERTDGIIYATAAGLGFATILNINFVLSSGGVNLGVGALHIVLTAMAQASFAGITGYFLSKEKLDHAPAWWMPVGLTLAAILNGVFFTLYGTLSKSTFTSSGAYARPWFGLILALVLTVGLVGTLTYLIQRDQSRASRQGGQ